MCGIAGTVGLPYDKATQSAMLATMRHRGPDDEGTMTQQACCLLHSRLSVVDPEGGRQPMQLFYQGQTYTIVYNGELYNTPEIRKMLLKLGHTFNGHSDTEVVLHAFAQWSVGCLEKLNGIFAFAVWENKSNKLTLARDKMGVKPLFYAEHKGGILFASEIKTILAYPTVKAQIDADGVREIILLGPGRTPGCGVFKGISELEPGCFGCFVDGKWSTGRYWELRDAEHNETFEETAEHVGYLVQDAIKRQMVSDVPIGTFLSGGLDSSIISSVCADALPDGEQLKTFSVDYENNDTFFVPGKFQPDSDGKYIRIMQASLNSDHDWTILAPEDLIGALELATQARDLPGMADVDFSLLLFCRHIRTKVKVALSGECADEVFGGYPWYRDPEIRSMEGFPWSQNTALRAGLLQPQYGDQAVCYDYVQERYLNTINQCDILPGTNALERRMKEMMVLNLRWFMQTLLDRKDRMSMHSSLEVRVPFCDYRIAEYLYHVPWEYKNYQGREKGLLRYAMRAYLPEQVLYRKKSPYPKTHDPRYAQLVTERVDALLSDRSAPVFQIVKPDALAGMLQESFSWPWYGQLMRQPQTLAYILQINYWLKSYNIDIFP